MKTEKFHYSRESGWDNFPDHSWDSDQTLLMIHFSTFFEDFAKPLNQLRAAFPKSCWIGCSTSGHFLDDAIDDDGVVVVVAKFETTRLRQASARFSEGADIRAIGQSLAQDLWREDLRGLMVMAEGLLLNGSELIEGLAVVIPAKVPVFGGLAGDGGRFQNTLVISGKVPTAKTVTAVGFYGEDFTIRVATSGGWDWIGPDRLITGAEGNKLLTLDNRPALSLYKQYLGDLSDDLPTSGIRFPLGIHSSETQQCETLRMIRSIDEQEGSITLCGNVAEGSFARLMHANRERLIQAAADATDMLLQSTDHDGGGLAFIATCIGRRMILGSDAVEEINVARQGLPKRHALIGFYTYGEIAPLANNELAFHNQTFTIGLLQEAKCTDT